jgi:hypothetical protein
VAARIAPSPVIRVLWLWTHGAVIENEALHTRDRGEPVCRE